MALLMMQSQSLRFSLLSSAPRSTRWRQTTPISMIVTISSTTRTCRSSFSGSSNKIKIKEPLRPYSGSLPSPGYEWCQRCNIPSKELQKAIGQPNPCLDRPARQPGGICPAARHYYQQQITYMFFFTALCFVALPGDFLHFGNNNHDDFDDDFKK